MAHNHSHHHHEHPVEMKDVNRAFIVGICLNLLFVVVEAAAGFFIHSLSLLSDAGHNLADVGALGLSLLAFKLLKIKSTDRYTYGYKKTSVLVALLNCIILLISIGAIVFEAVQRFLHPEPLPGTVIAVVAGIGIVINFVTGMLFMRGKERDLNVKSAYLHLMADAVVSLGIVIGGIIIIYTGWFWIDSILSILIAIVILVSTWNVLKESLRLSLDAVPENIEMSKIKAVPLEVKGVKELHHVHVWALSTVENALTAHVVIANGTSHEQERQIKHELKHQFEHLNIQHVTLEIEMENEQCSGNRC